MTFARATSGTDLLPHLVADPPMRAYLSSESGRLLLRFDGYVHNAGPGPLEVTGQRSSVTVPMVPHQRIYRSDGSTYEVVMPGAQMVYASADGHHHWHLQFIVAYSLWNHQRTREVAPAMKVGFCLADHAHVDPSLGPAAPVYSDDHGRDFCQKYNPDALSVWEGVSAGWRDLYERSLTFQWIDVSDVVPGVYWLREDADPNHIVRDAHPHDRKPAYAASATVIPGYTASPMELGSSAPGRPVTVILDARRYGPTGDVQYRIVTPPRHGHLDVQTGGMLGHATVVYRPDPGYRGPDSFIYIAKDSASRYPYDPVRAAVNLNVGPPVISSLGISPHAFRLGPLRPGFGGHPRVGTTIGFTLSERARVKLAFTRCVRTAGRGCTASTHAGVIVLRGRRGTQRLRFDGRLASGTSLRPGSYVLTVTASDSAGRSAGPRGQGFTLLPA